jgi:hypothetical protein
MAISRRGSYTLAPRSAFEVQGMARYKVRLDDGSEIVLELQAVKDWYTQGLLTRDSPVLRPGSSQWLPLVRALNLVSAPPAAPSAPPRPASMRRSRPPATLPGPALRLALVLLVAVVVAVLAWRLWPAPNAPAGASAATTPDPKLSLDQLRAESVAAVAREVPLFSASTADRLVRLSEAQALAPEEAFRRGFRYAALGIAFLPSAEAREMSSLTAAAYARLSARERAQMGAYLDKVKANRVTTAQEDREAAAVMKRALQGFPAARLERIRQLYGKAMEAGLARG